MTLNDQIFAYLTQNKIAFAAGDYQTGQPEGQPDQVLVWNTTKLGTQPTATQLSDAYAAQQLTLQWQAYQAQAHQALAKTDITVNRITEGVVKGTCVLTNADVVAYMNYRGSLRAILTQAQPSTIPTSLPTHAPLPAGT